MLLSQLMIGSIDVSGGSVTCVQCQFWCVEDGVDADGERGAAQAVDELVRYFSRKSSTLASMSNYIIVFTMRYVLLLLWHSASPGL